MRFDEYRRHDATALAGLIAKGEVSAKDVLETAIARAEQVNPAINAIVHKQYDQARSRGRRRSCPAVRSAGVPYLIKDLGILQTGEPATFGSSLFKDFVADHDSAYVARCKKAGLVIMGRSSSPEFGLNPNTEPRLYGPCRNPWNLEHSPAARRAAPRRPSSPASCRWRTPPTAAARSASRRPSAGCSASSPRAGASRWHPTRARAGAGSRSATS